jgi:shikimate dehydrogenase
MKRIDMIGSPLAHVLTPALLNARLAADGLGLSVTPREISTSDLAGYVAAARGRGALTGLVVTTPLKEAICGHLDRKTALVELIGSCNCIRADGGSWIGANFDGFGFAQALANAGVMLKGKRVLLMGCGGAGKAIAERVAGEGAAALLISDPLAGRAAAFAHRLGSKIVAAGEFPSGDIDIVVNASPLGMKPDDPSPVPPEIVAGCSVVVDIVVAADSRLRRLARDRGKLVVEGEAMVKSQVDLFRSFMLSGATSEAAAMRQAAGGVLAERTS